MSIAPFSSLVDDGGGNDEVMIIAPNLLGLESGELTETIFDGKCNTGDTNNSSVFLLFLFINICDHWPH